MKTPRIVPDGISQLRLVARAGVDLDRARDAARSLHRSTASTTPRSPTQQRFREPPTRCGQSPRSAPDVFSRPWLAAQWSRAASIV
ncbi:hypothetical protein DMP23_45960 [Amycolatopsis sp. A1MSW2902]